MIERSFAAPVERVFAFWSDAEKKRRWLSCHEDWTSVDYRLDFRNGGTELNKVLEPDGKVLEPDGTVHLFKAQYLDIVPGARIVYAYEMLVSDARISASLVTVMFEAGSAKTRMTFTEQVVFLDGHGDLQERREGTDVGMSRLEAELGLLR